MKLYHIDYIKSDIIDISQIKNIPKENNIEYTEPVKADYETTNLNKFIYNYNLLKADKSVSDIVVTTATILDNSLRQLTEEDVNSIIKAVELTTDQEFSKIINVDNNK